MKTIALLVAIVAAAPASAQSRVYGNADLGKPVAPPTRLSPEEAVRVLRASHSIADLTDYRSPGHGPTIVVMGESTTPWDWPAAAFAPTRPLGNDFGADLYAPIGFGYAPSYASSYSGYASSYSGRQRHSGHGQPASRRTDHLVTQVQLPPSPPASAPPRHIVMSSQAAGRRR